MRILPSFFAICLAIALPLAAQNPCPHAQEVPSALRLPANLPAGEPKDFEKQLLAYFSTLGYRNLGWCEDKSIRDTGPYMNDVPAIIHPPVHIYYSREVSEWLLHDRKGAIPDGAVIIKEQYTHTNSHGQTDPAAYYADVPLNDLPNPQDWSFMIKNSKASRDGWFWGEVWTGQPKSETEFEYPNAGYGLYCLRCHASAERELTFSSLKNIKGAPGWPLQYRVDNSWLDQLTSANLAVPQSAAQVKTVSPEDAAKLTEYLIHGENATELSRHPAHAQNAILLAKTPHPAAPPGPVPIQPMPPEPLDNTVAAPLPGVLGATSLGFVTSSQCLGCHSGLTSAGLGPTMVIPADPTHRGTTTASTPDGINVSPYGEWRWSPMGLAGRDPVFFSQLDSELDYLKASPDKQQLVVNTCMTCHGAMGKRSYANDFPKKDFKLDFVYETDPSHEGFKYGALARDGISCQVCHRMAAPPDRSLGYFLNNLVNGTFALTPADSLNGPFDDNVITQYPMNASLGIKPRHDGYIESSQMCGSCHTIVLPILDRHVMATSTYDRREVNGKPVGPETKDKYDGYSVEQATYLEWLNSQYRNEYGSVGATPQTCQQCHMPSGYINDRTNVSVPAIQDRFAIVQDLTYPGAEHLATPDQINVRYRTSGYVRHEFLGTNGFLLQMFQQPVDKNGDNKILGVRLGDYMTVSTNDLPNASANVVQQAQSKIAQVSFSKWQIVDGKLIVEVRVQNEVGHRYPSGVGFRRAFLELQATIDGKPFFTSGGTDSLGRIVDNSGKILPTESFTGGQFQPHFSQSNPIRDSSQVQIYEELMKDADGHFTTEFTRRDQTVKDNRLLPIGWSRDGPPGVKMPDFFLESTRPFGDALKDPVYQAGEGQSIVRYEIALPPGVAPERVKATATLYTQNTPPYFLDDRSRTKTPATERFRYLTDSLHTLANTDYADWKLLIATARR